MDILTQSEINLWLKKIKKSCMKVYSNCFIRLENSGSELSGAFSDMSLIWLKNENGVEQIMFYTVDFSDLTALLNKKLDNGDYVVEIITKDKEFFQSMFRARGFDLLACMMRMCNSDIKKYFDSRPAVRMYENENHGTKASEEDADLILKTLYEVFDTRISHLPDHDQICKSIKNNEFYICREDDKIISLLQTVVKPASFYINQVYNAADKKVIHSILLANLHNYIDQGGKYIYSWVDEKNTASVKFHNKYGMAPDGLWDIVYAGRINDRV